MKSIIGIGLVALDIVIEKSSNTKPNLFAGGSCGNVLIILSYLGFDTFPIARLANNKATEELINDIAFWGVNNDLIIKADDGSTPIIIQRISNSKDGNSIHRFEFRNPENGKYLPSFKPVLVKSIEMLYSKISKCDFFYLDRISRSSIELAKLYKNNGAIVIYEPSSIKIDNLSLTNELIEIIDIIKFSNERIPNYKDLIPQGKIPLEIETLGKDGINYRTQNLNDWKHIIPFSVNKVVDSAGAGDWTTAGIIKSLIDYNITKIIDIDNTTLESILKYAQALGALSCFYKGARGLMYQVERDNLSILINELINNKTIKIELMESGLPARSMIFENSISSLI